MFCKTKLRKKIERKSFGEKMWKKNFEENIFKMLGISIVVIWRLIDVREG